MSGATMPLVTQGHTIDHFVSISQKKLLAGKKFRNDICQILCSANLLHFKMFPLFCGEKLKVRVGACVD